MSVNMGMYPCNAVPKPRGNATYAVVDWSNIEIPMECQLDSTEQDPFDDTETSGEPTTDRRQAALTRILSHAELVFQLARRSDFDAWREH